DTGAAPSAPLVASILLPSLSSFFVFCFHHTPTPEFYTLSYTTLFRSSVAGRRGQQPRRAGTHLQVEDGDVHGYTRSVAAGICSRSEEHTSELQSLRHLVCRLLLEKKKNDHDLVMVVLVAPANVPSHIS